MDMDSKVSVYCNALDCVYNEHQVRILCSECGGHLAHVCCLKEIKMNSCGECLQWKRKYEKGGPTYEQGRSVEQDQALA
jgi:hypothetical protein